MFEKAFLISLDFSEDRRASFFKQCPLTNVEVVNAVHGDTCQPPDNWKAGNGAWGCYRSHLNILERCLNERIGSYIVFEDDAQFRPGFLENLNLFMDHIPDDWEQAYLGGQLIHERICPPAKINSHVYRPFNVNRTHCFAVSRPGMVKIYQHICNLPFYGKEHIDHHLGRWHENPESKVFCPSKWLVGQMGFSSLISGKMESVQYYDDPETLAVSHPLHESNLCVLFHGSHELLRSAKLFLHQGNQLEEHGYDISLHLASQLKEPKPTILKWYNWIRTEIVRSKSKQVPCAYHPKVTKEDLEAVGLRVIEIFPKTLADIVKEMANLG